MSIVGRALAQSVEESSVVCTPNHANGSGPLPQANKAFQPPPPPPAVGELSSCSSSGHGNSLNRTVFVKV